MFAWVLVITLIRGQINRTLYICFGVTWGIIVISTILSSYYKIEKRAILINKEISK